MLLAGGIEPRVIEEILGAAGVHEARRGAILAASRDRTRPRARATPVRLQNMGGVHANLHVLSQLD